jgi:hypothetical protein
VPDELAIQMYGSRLDDKRLGGDLDMMIDTAERVDQARQALLQAEMKASLGVPGGPAGAVRDHSVESPLLDGKPRYSMKLRGIVGDQDAVLGKCMCGDQQIHATDRPPGALQCESDRGVAVRCLYGPRPDIESREPAFDGRRDAGRRKFCSAESEFSGDDR